MLVHALLLQPVQPLPLSPDSAFFWAHSFCLSLFHLLFSLFFATYVKHFSAPSSSSTDNCNWWHVLCMSNDWICVWSTCNFFFNYAKCIVNNEHNVQLIDNMVASKQASERKKNHYKSVPWQIRAKVDDSNAINIVSIDAYICTNPIHVVQNTNSVYTNTYGGQWSCTVEVKTR